ncbi:MAG: DUF3575 domain-containing protein [Bacteroidota bacterium]
MKLPVLAILFVCTTFSLNAQSNVIKINIFSPIVKTFNVQYEHKLSPTGSFQLGFFYTGYSTSGTDFSGFGITPEYRLYLSDTEAPKGVYLAPFVRYQSFNLTDGGNKGTLSLFGGGVIIGKQWLFKEKVALDIFIGPSYSSGNVKVTSGSDNFSTGAFDGFGIRTGLCLGYAF